jgi:hypothetical protein
MSESHVRAQGRQDFYFTFNYVTEPLSTIVDQINELKTINQSSLTGMDERIKGFQQNFIRLRDFDLSWLEFKEKVLFEAIGKTTVVQCRLVSPHRQL